MFPHLRPAVISRLFCGELRGRALLEQPRITASKGTTFNLFSPLRVYFYESISFNTKLPRFSIRPKEGRLLVEDHAGLLS